MTQLSHPLDPLLTEEFEKITEILHHGKGVTSNVENRWRYAAIEMIEPSKPEIEAFEKTGVWPERIAGVNLVHCQTNKIYQARVSLDSEKVLAFEHLPGVQPNMTVDETEEADRMLSANKEFQEILRRRGITDMDLVFNDTWSYGEAVAPQEYVDRRIAWSTTWVRSQEEGNPFAHPVAGLHAIIDLNAMEILRIEQDEEVPVPEHMGEYVPRLIPRRIRDAGTRPEIKPLDIVQKEGSSFAVKGRQLQWQNWSMRIGFNYREGMTIHRLTYTHEGKERSVANRLSFAEMAVPYRNEGQAHFRRSVFDVGEFGLGFFTDSLTLGCDCLGDITYLDAVMHDSAGKPYTIKNAICIHEEDDGVLWKHVDEQYGAQVRRSRRLVVSFHVTVSNYDYLVYWRFYQDGNIECEVRATGIMIVSFLPEGCADTHSTLVDERTWAPYHQHFLVARLDLDIDGTENTVYRTESLIDPISEHNPHGLSITQVNQPIIVEGFDDINWQTQRMWKVVNDNVKNKLGTSVSYKLVPTDAIPAMFDDRSSLVKRTGIIKHNVWVTANDPAERWPAGEFVNQSGQERDGITDWTAQKRTVENTDVVLWYVFGVHHIPRPEDWPVMPVDIVKFMLKPVGFFDRNPALDVKANAPKQCKGCC